GRSCRKGGPLRAVRGVIATAIVTRQVKHLNFRPAKEPGTVAKPELGIKRMCANCGAKFYDLNKDPPICPKCHTVMELATLAPRGRPDAAVAAEHAAAPAPEEEVAAPETAEAEFVSLEEADAEAQGKKKAPEGEAVGGGEGGGGVGDGGKDDGGFIEEQEEGDEDVTDIIGDVDDEEETCSQLRSAATASLLLVMSRPARYNSCEVRTRLSPTPRPAWGHSSVGRALEWHSRGQGFDSPWLHQFMLIINDISSHPFFGSIVGRL